MWNAANLSDKLEVDCEAIKCGNEAKFELEFVFLSFLSECYEVFFFFF